ncbi:HEPN domain-containing protein [Thermus oshimai]
MNRARDWLAQAEHNLRHAQASLGFGDWAWACFGGGSGAASGKGSRLR